MNTVVKSEHGVMYATCQSPDDVIHNTQDMLDLMAFAGEHGTNLLLLDERNLDEAFYDLSTGLAGEIAQKLFNYRTRLVVVGTFESVRSKRFREFMYETNKGTQLSFLKDTDAAIRWMTKEAFR
jgi:hypothetical protein